MLKYTEGWLMTKELFTNQELRILYVMYRHGGRSNFNHMLSECGMCLGMFINNAEKLIDKGLITKGDSFEEYVLLPKGKRVVVEKMAVFDDLND